MKAVIVDDESSNRNVLQALIEDYCPQVNIVDSANDVLSGVKAINTHLPDLVFLDIEMPNYNGFKLIEYFDEPFFEIVFTTAHERHAIAAFKKSAIGYLLKPIDIDALINVVEKVEKKLKKQSNSLLNNTPTSPKYSSTKKIKIPAKKGFLYISVQEILFLQADGRDTFITLTSGDKVKTNLNLKECEKLLFYTPILRIHRSNMINLAYIKKYVKKLDSYIVMENGDRLDIGQAYKEQLLTALSFFVK